MSFLLIPKETVKYRRKNELEDSCINPEQLLDPFIHRLSVSEIEIDLTASFILNRFSIENIKNSEHINPGIASIWNDERVRREKINKPIEMPASQERLNVPITESDFMYRQIISQKIKDLTSSDETILNSSSFMNSTITEDVTKRKFNLKSILNNAVYPAECSQDLGNLLDASIIQNHIVSSNRTLFSQNILSSNEGETDINFNLDESIVDETIALSLSQKPSLNETLSPEDLAFLEVMKLLEDGDDDDSILAPLTQTKPPDSQILLSQKEATVENVAEVIERENDSDSDDDILNDYSMAMDETIIECEEKSSKEEDIWENSFWDNIKLPQLDGGHEIKTPPRLGKRSKIMKISPKSSPRVGRKNTPRKSPSAIIRSKYQPLDITVTNSPIYTNGEFFFVQFLDSFLD